MCIQPFIWHPVSGKAIRIYPRCAVWEVGGSTTWWKKLQPFRHECDVQKDGQADGRNYESIYRACRAVMIDPSTSGRWRTSNPLFSAEVTWSMAMISVLMSSTAGWWHQDVFVLALHAVEADGRLGRAGCGVIFQILRLFVHYKANLTTRSYLLWHQYWIYKIWHKTHSMNYEKLWFLW